MPAMSAKQAATPRARLLQRLLSGPRFRRAAFRGAAFREGAIRGAALRASRARLH